MTAILVAPPSSPARTLGRLLLGPSLTADERAVVRAVLGRAPAVGRLRRPTWLGRLGRITRRLGILVAGIAIFGMLNLATAPSAQGFSIFGPVKHALKDAFNDFVTWLAEQVCNFVGSFCHGVLTYVDRGLAINFGLSWFKDNYEHMMVGGFLMGLAILVVQGMVAALRRNPTMLLQAVAATLAGVLLSFIGLSLIMMVSGAIDDWCAAVTGGKSIADGTQKTIHALPNKIGGVGAMLVAILYLVFALLLFIVMIVRRLGIYVISLFIPVYAGGLAGGWTSGMVKRASELLFVLLMSKLAIIGTFTLGASMLVGDTKGLDPVTNTISGVVVMAFAVLSPLGVMYLVAFADGLMVGQMAAAASHGRAGVGGGARSVANQIRGHNGNGQRTALGRVTGAGHRRVTQGQSAGGRGAAGLVIGAARRAAGNRQRPGGGNSRPGGGNTAEAGRRQARARGARRAAGSGRPPAEQAGRTETNRRPRDDDSARGWPT